MLSPLSGSSSTGRPRAVLQALASVLVSLLLALSPSTMLLNIIDLSMTSKSTPPHLTSILRSRLVYPTTFWHFHLSVKLNMSKAELIFSPILPIPSSQSLPHHRKWHLHLPKCPHAFTRRSYRHLRNMSWVQLLLSFSLLCPSPTDHHPAWIRTGFQSVSPPPLFLT